MSENLKHMVTVSEDTARSIDYFFNQLEGSAAFLSENGYTEKSFVVKEAVSMLKLILSKNLIKQEIDPSFTPVIILSQGRLCNIDVILGNGDVLTNEIEVEYIESNPDNIYLKFGANIPSKFRYEVYRAIELKFKCYVDGVFFTIKF